MEKDLAAISSHRGSEESKDSSSYKNAKKSKVISNLESNKKNKDLTDMESVQGIIKQLINEIIDLKKNKGEGKKPFKSLFKKKTNMDTSSQIPPTSGINLEYYAMENYFHTHHVNHLERICPEFINSFTAMLLPPEPPKKESKNEKEKDDDEKQEKAEEEEEEEEPPSHLNMIWDEVEFDNDDDDILEDACVGHSYNLHSKGAPK